MTGSFVTQNRILVLDDNDTIHDDFRDILCDSMDRSSAMEDAKNAIFGDSFNSRVTATKTNYIVDSAYQGQEGLRMVEQSIKENRPYAMAFVDVRMPPGWDGIETIKRLWDVSPQLQIVVCTAYSDYSWQDMVNELGMTDRLLILKKPVETSEVLQITCSLMEKWHLLNDLENVVRQRTKQINETRNVAVFALAKLAESRDPETGEHLERMRGYCQILAEKLQHKGHYKKLINDLFLEDLYRSTPLHDIGKVGIPDSVLRKPGKLTKEEFEIMKTHTIIGAEALADAVKSTENGGFLDMAVKIARHHHERFDGTGYPDGLSGVAIPLEARIAALADVYDALTSKRVYKAAFDSEKACKMIVEGRGTQFDPVLVDLFLEVHEELLEVKRIVESG